MPGTEWQYVYVEQPLLRDVFLCNAFSLLFVWSEFREMICFCFPQDSGLAEDVMENVTGSHMLRGGKNTRTL